VDLLFDSNLSFGRGLRAMLSVWEVAPHLPHLRYFRSPPCGSVVSAEQSHSSLSTARHWRFHEESAD
jgi:hypothetical protein